MRIRKALNRLNWMATAVFAMGVLSIAILIWIVRLSQDLHTGFALCDAIMDMRIKAASSHLWLEEAVSRNTPADMARAFGDMDQAAGLAEAILKGGKNEHGTPLVPLKDLHQRNEAEAIYASLIQFRTIAVERARDQNNAQGGSLLDEKLNKVYEASQGKAWALEDLLENNLMMAKTRSDDLFRVVLIAWSCVVAGATRALWNLEARRKAAEKRLESIAEAANTMENIGYVFSGIRHEIGNPINSIKMSLSALAGKIDTCPRETIKEHIGWTAAEVARVEYLLRALKNFNMYETPELESVHLATFMDMFLSLASADFAKKGIRIESRMHPEAGWGCVDPRALQQVMLNIVSNAVDALEGRQNPQIMIEGFKADGFLTIRTMDNGNGMSEEQRRELFKPFRTTKPGGTGLGLVIARKMLNAMKGTIAIESRLDQGTTVSISIPEGRCEDRQEKKNAPRH